jgi:uncharacterized metal-binding protein
VASGKQHTQASLVLAGFISSLGLVTTAPSTAILPLAIGAASGTILTPDFDVDTGCIAFRNMEWMFGTPAGKLWRWIWKPYALAVKHRSWISHAPFIGTILRLLYLLVFLSWIPFVIELDYISISEWMKWWFVGLSIADFIHFLMDILPFWRKHERKN